MSEVRFVRVGLYFNWKSPDYSSSLKDFLRFSKEMEDLGMPLVSEESEGDSDGLWVNAFFSGSSQEEFEQAINFIENDLAEAFRCEHYEMLDLTDKQIQYCVRFAEQLPEGFVAFSLESLDIRDPRTLNQIEKGEVEEKVRVHTLRWKEEK